MSPQAAAVALALLLPLGALAPAAEASEALWSLLKGGGQAVLIRHAITTPGVGDPPGMRLDDCATQRNLTDEGRRDAGRLGEAFRQRAIPVDRVLSSRYCRCMDTARFAFGEGLAEPVEALDPLSGDEAAKEKQKEEIRKLVREFDGSGNLVLVTHQENIREVAGVSPREGEAVIVRPEGDQLIVIGRIIFN